MSAHQELLLSVDTPRDRSLPMDVAQLWRGELADACLITKAGKHEHLAPVAVLPSGVRVTRCRRGGSQTASGSSTTT